MRNLLKIYIYNLEIYLFLYILSNYLYLWLLWISNVISWGASSKQEYLLWVVTCANFTALMKKCWFTWNAIVLQMKKVAYSYSYIS